MKINKQTSETSARLNDDAEPLDMYIAIHRPSAEMHIQAEEEHVDAEWDVVNHKGDPNVRLHLKLSGGGLMDAKAHVVLTPDQAVRLGGDLYNGAKVAQGQDDG